MFENLFSFKLEVGTSEFLIVSAILFLIGVTGIFLNKKNIIALLLSIELMLLAVNLNFVTFSNHLGDLAGQIFVLFILTVAAAEVSIGLAILVIFFRRSSSIEVDVASKLKG